MQPFHLFFWYSIDSEYAALGWDIERGQIKAEGDESKDASGNPLGRTLSFLRKMTAIRKVGAQLSLSVFQKAKQLA